MAAASAAAERSDVAVKGLFNQLLAVMEKNSAGIINDHDKERLHDYRVAVRRSRVLLGQMPQVLPKRITERYGHRLAQLGALTTPLRDLDVLLIKFERYRALLPKELQNEIYPALNLIESKRQQHQQQLIKHLQSADYRRFISGWQNYLHNSAPANTTLTNAKRPIKALADERIWTLYKKALQQGERITKRSPATDLHDLRKRCKKLRYLIEAFQPLYPEQKIAHLVKVLKELQDHLGELQDLDVHHDLFQQLYSEIDQQPCKKVLKQLSKRLVQQHDRERNHFHGYFKAFASHHHRQQFRGLYKSGQRDRMPVRTNN